MYRGILNKRSILSPGKIHEGIYFVKREFKEKGKGIFPPRSPTCFPSPGESPSSTLPTRMGKGGNSRGNLPGETKKKEGENEREYLVINY